MKTDEHQKDEKAAIQQHNTTTQQNTKRWNVDAIVVYWLACSPSEQKIECSNSVRV